MPLYRCNGVFSPTLVTNEFQGDGTAHGHGFVSLANAYQHSTLEDIADKIEENVEFLKRTVKFNTHLQTEEHLDHDAHQRNFESIEESFRKIAKSRAMR